MRSLFIDGLSPNKITKKFGYSLHTVYTYAKQFKKTKELPIFLPFHPGPKGPHSKTISANGQIIELRKKNYSILEIQEKLEQKGKFLTPRSIESVLTKEGFARLFRRTKAERLEVLQSSTDYPQEASVSDFGIYKKMSTSFGGIFLFIPLFLKLKLDKAFIVSNFYGSKQIPRLNYLLSYLAIKLLGKERFSHIIDFSFDLGLGGSVGLNVLPKSTAITQYSYRHPHSTVVSFLREIVNRFYEPGCFKSEIVNLDFHSIPHYGDESQLETNWIPVRNKRMKSILALFAQDMESTYLCYSNGCIEKDEQNDAIFQYLIFSKKSINKVPEYLVFDSKLTTYRHLSKLNQEYKGKVKFITLRRRGKNFLKMVESIESWTSITLDNVKRKYRYLKVSESYVSLEGYEGKAR